MVKERFAVTSTIAHWPVILRSLVPEFIGQRAFCGHQYHTSLARERVAVTSIIANWLVILRSLVPDLNGQRAFCGHQYHNSLARKHFAVISTQTHWPESILRSTSTVTHWPESVSWSPVLDGQNSAQATRARFVDASQRCQPPFLFCGTCMHVLIFD